MLPTTWPHARMRTHATRAPRGLGTCRYTQLQQALPAGACHQPTPAPLPPSPPSLPCLAPPPLHLQGLKERLRAAAPSSLVLEQFVGPAELADVYRKTRLNVHPPTYDAYGMTVVEAASQVRVRGLLWIAGKGGEAWGWCCQVHGWRGWGSGRGGKNGPTPYWHTTFHVRWTGAGGDAVQHPCLLVWAGL